MRRFTPYMDLCSGECVTAFKNVSFYFADEAQAEIDAGVDFLEFSLRMWNDQAINAYPNNLKEIMAYIDKHSRRTTKQA